MKQAYVNAVLTEQHASIWGQVKRVRISVSLDLSSRHIGVMALT